MAAERHLSSRRKSFHPRRTTAQWGSTLSHSIWNLRGSKFARYTHKERFQQAHNGHGRTKTRRCTGSWDVQGHRSSNMIQRGLGTLTKRIPGGTAGVAGGAEAESGCAERGCAERGYAESGCAPASMKRQYTGMPSKQTRGGQLTKEATPRGRGP